MPDAVSTLKSARNDFFDWLFKSAYPLWWTVGGDLANGGFMEKIAHNGRPIEAPRRTRVVGRQIYSYARAKTMGWEGPADQAVSHGLEFLLLRCLKADKTFHSQVTPSGSAVRPDFDLYDHAFALFGLAAAATMRDDHERLANIARDVRSAMIDGWKHPDRGFEETVPRTLPLKANPHMHIFEASLAWIDAGPSVGDDGWDEIADEIAELCLTKFLHPENGSLREFYDGDWRPVSGDEGRVIEPGHQFEWAWLLKRWGLLRNRPDALAAARRLVEIAETHGTDAMRGVTINELLDDFSIRDNKARLWPQTERIKAWIAMADVAETDEVRDTAYTKAAAATRGLLKYFQTETPGLWFDRMREDGSFVDEPAPASSLYHIVCAANELHGLTI